MVSRPQGSATEPRHPEAHPQGPEAEILWGDVLPRCIAQVQVAQPAR